MLDLLVIVSVFLIWIGGVMIGFGVGYGAGRKE